MSKRKRRDPGGPDHCKIRFSSHYTGSEFRFLFFSSTALNCRARSKGSISSWWYCETMRCKQYINTRSRPLYRRAACTYLSIVTRKMAKEIRQAYEDQPPRNPAAGAAARACTFQG